MKFNPQTNKVDPDSLTIEEAKVFIVFLESEILRHFEDITQTSQLIGRIKEKFNL
jgi:hypothetical protein